MKARHRPARLDTFTQIRAWAAATGLVLTGFFVGAVLMGREPIDLVPMLVTAIGGFEFALYANDLWHGRRTRHG